MAALELVLALAAGSIVRGVLRLWEVALRHRAQVRLEEGRHRALSALLDAAPDRSLVVLGYPDGTA
jgi:hypothetical protein